PAAERVPRDQSLPGERLPSGRGGRRLDDELVEERRGKRPHDTGRLQARGDRVRRFEVRRGEPSEPAAAEGGEGDGHGERAQTLIGADVRGRALAADVLLPGR